MERLQDLDDVPLLSTQGGHEYSDNASILSDSSSYVTDMGDVGGEDMGATTNHSADLREEAAKKHSDLSSQEEKATKESSNDVKDCAFYKNAYEQALKKISCLEAQVSRKIGQLDAVYTRLRETRNSSFHKRQETREIIRNMQKNNARILDERNQLIEHGDLLYYEIDALNNQVEELNTTMEDMREENTKLQNENSHATKNEDQLINQKEQLDATINDMLGANAKLTSENNMFREILRTQEEIINEQNSNTIAEDTIGLRRQAVVEQVIDGFIEEVGRKFDELVEKEGEICDMMDRTLLVAEAVSMEPLNPKQKEVVMSNYKNIFDRIESILLEREELSSSYRKLCTSMIKIKAEERGKKIELAAATNTQAAEGENGD